jgi:hypothetical protein
MLTNWMEFLEVGFGIMERIEMTLNRDRWR